MRGTYEKRSMGTVERGLTAEEIEERDIYIST